ncbi:MAG: hypothetical protein ABII06_11460 [Pseudomonadota bacterium]
MERYTVHLRYYVGDPLEEIRQEDLDSIGKKFGMGISFERIEKRTPVKGELREETLDRAIEEITQDVITVSSEDEDRFRKAITAIYEKYRSPRTPYGFWGSSREGERIAKIIANETDGGW